MIVTMITEDSSITVNGDQLTVPVAADLGEWAVQFDGESAEVEYSDGRPNEVINATTFYARYQSDIDAHAAERLALNEAAALASIPTTAQLIAQLTAERKLQEQQGVTVNDIRYAGDPSNRQAIAEPCNLWPTLKQPSSRYGKTLTMCFTLTTRWLMSLTPTGPLECAVCSLSQQRASMPRRFKTAHSRTLQG